jgi:ferric-dicitrate binding protein FerR (iron transport regulator)
MEKMEHVETLLKKFHAGNISLPEKKALLEYLETGGNERLLKAFLYKQWDRGNDNIHYNSADTFEALRSQLNMPQDNYKQAKHGIFNKHVYFQILRYAAIILVTFFISLLYYNQRGEENLPEGDNVKFIVENGSKGTVVLPDGSKVWLNSGSELIYPPDLSLKGNRKVKLIGEAFFDIRKNTDNPFYIKTKKVNIKVLGTKFNVKSYPDEEDVKATLISGEILLYKDKEEDKAVHLNRPHQQAVIRGRDFETRSNNNSNNNIPIEAGKVEKTKIRINQIDEPALAVSWKEGQLKFKKESFKSLSKRLERWYDVDISFKDDKLKEITFTGTFEKENIEQVLHALSLSYPFNYKLNKNKIFISSI